MKAPALPSLLSAAVLLGLPWPQSLGATTGIQRCEAADGTAIYTDRACPTVGGTPAPMQAELLTRIAADEARNASSAALADGSFQADPLLDSPPTGRRSPQSGCARSKQQLLMDVRGSFALHNVNRLAESYHWVGKSNRQAQQQMLQLERMATLSLQQATLFDGTISSGAVEDGMSNAPDAASSDPAGTLQLTLVKRGSLQVVDLDVTRYSGCYFARI